jgi:uncharacterized membrane-anchored protein YjiN (DUF445 family)
MNDILKAQQLKKHKRLATGLFLLMLVVYVLTTWLTKSYEAAWTGYVKAFSEAAMVGALADWFAVTALFHHPLGIPIPHTNLIENSKKSIGDNLGNFVVSNFLTASNIRPYIKRLTIASYAAQWLSKEKNKAVLVAEVSRLLKDIISKADDESIIHFMVKRGRGLLNDVELHVMVSNALHYFINKKEHEKLVTILAQKIKEYIVENEALVKEKVKQESSFFIPRFIDNKLAKKISNGLINYFDEVENDSAHRIRQEITTQLYHFSESLRTEPKWEDEFEQLKMSLLPEEKLHEYAKDLWTSLKATLQRELSHKNSALVKYFAKNLDELAFSLNTDVALQQKIDGWVHYNAYKYILKNTNRVGALISDTVGNWQGKELSKKLELEVGKDLQFIRINGTLVGGLVGLLIHAITSIFL